MDFEEEHFLTEKHIYKDLTRKKIKTDFLKNAKLTLKQINKTCCF